MIAALKLGPRCCQGIGSEMLSRNLKIASCTCFELEIEVRIKLYLCLELV